VMGYPMAVNLRAKIGKEKTIVVCDVSAQACDKFRAEESVHGPIEIVANGYEAIQVAVSGPKRRSQPHFANTSGEHLVDSIAVE
jgi:hypothetical protein